MSTLALGEAIPTDPALHQVIRQLSRGGSVDDDQLDRILPRWARVASRMHWTPLPVIRRTIDLLIRSHPQSPARPLRVMDAGSGVGKFCLVGALLSQARFFGVEQRPHFVELSRKLAERYRIPRVSFIEANLESVDWSAFDAVYLYNPFQEHRAPAQRIDPTIELDSATFDRYVSLTRRKLGQLRPGARVATYHGFGGSFPPGFGKLSGEFCHRGWLECWERLECR